MKRMPKGFTLVEIAIVLVIIGLLLGGVLKGQEMIVQAKVKNTISDFSGVSAAYFGYQDRYRATPGDDAGATRWTGAQVGDGNRTLTGLYNDTTTTVAALNPGNETRLWWDHLRRSGFVAGAGPLQPFNSFGGMIGVQTGNGAAAPVAVLVNATGGFTSIIMCSTNLPDKVAIAVDVQMDDGIPNSGAVRAALVPASPAVDAALAMPATYLETGTNIYLLCRTF